MHEIEVAAWAFDGSNDMPAWTALGVDTEQVWQWRNRGYFAGECAEMLGLGITDPDDADLYTATVGTDPVRRDAFSRFLNVGWSTTDAAAAVQAGFVTPEEHAWWQTRGFPDGMTPEDLWEDVWAAEQELDDGGIGSTWRDIKDDWHNEWGTIGARIAGVYNPDDMVAVRDNTTNPIPVYPPPRNTPVEPRRVAVWYLNDVPFGFAQTVINQGYGPDTVARLHREGFSRADRMHTRWPIEPYDPYNMWYAQGFSRSDATNWQQTPTGSEVLPVDAQFWTDHAVSREDALRFESEFRPRSTAERQVILVVHQRGGDQHAIRAVLDSHRGDITA